MTETSKGYEGLGSFILWVQIVGNRHDKLEVFMKERGETVKEMPELSDQLLEAQSQSNMRKLPSEALGNCIEGNSPAVATGSGAKTSIRCYFVSEI